VRLISTYAERSGIQRRHTIATDAPSVATAGSSPTPICTGIWRARPSLPSEVANTFRSLVAQVTTKRLAVAATEIPRERSGDAFGRVSRWVTLPSRSSTATCTAPEKWERRYAITVTWPFDAA
jgi:hypothetical protein